VETTEGTGVYTTLVKASFEVFSKVGKGYRQKREPFVLDTSHDSFNVMGGACVTSGCRFFSNHNPQKDIVLSRAVEPLLAFHCPFS
jgi:hypothetical protein